MLTAHLISRLMQLANYKTTQGQSIYDVVNGVYGSLDYFSQLLIENANLEAVAYTLIDESAVEVEYDADVIRNKPPVIFRSTGAIATTITEYPALDGQSVYDVAMMTYGSLDKLIELLNDSSFGSTNNTNLGGVRFTFDSSRKTDQILQYNIDRFALVFSNAPRITEADLTTRYRVTTSFDQRITQNADNRIVT